MATYNTLQISKLEEQIVAQRDILDHLIDVMKLQEEHFKAIDEKIDTISNTLANRINVYKDHVKITDYLSKHLLLLSKFVIASYIRPASTDTHQVHFTTMHYLPLSTMATKSLHRGTS